MEWEAAVTLAWRGRSWTIHHHSQRIFLTIPGWRVLVDDAARLAAPTGLAQQAAEWPACVWRLAEAPNLAHPHIVFPGRFLQGRSAEGQAACLVATVVSPDERDVFLLFGTASPIDFFVNGQPVKLTIPVESSPFFTNRIYCTESFRLRRGENTLLAVSQPPEEGAWYVSAALLGSDGRMMSDLQFEPGPER